MGRRVLIVDDSGSSRHRTRLAVEALGHSVEEADDGRGGLEVCEQSEERFDLIICDFNMPRLTGLEMVERVRRLPGYANTPIFILSADFNPDLRRRGKAARVNAWLRKPLSRESLVACVNRALVGEEGAA